MAQSSSPISAVAERYASSLFELALQDNSVAKVEADLNDFEAMLDGSADLSRLIDSPVFSSEDQAKAIGAIVGKAKI
ncbi:MAG: F0F1 ATP synthase subunit delta, partial [Mesorhizobium sp.]